MAFAASGLAFLAGANNGGPRLWSYATSDAKADVDTAGYFSSMSAQLNVGDIIIAKTSDGTGFLLVNANSSGTVDVADMVVAGSTDTD